MEFSDVQGWLGAAKDAVSLLRAATTLLPKGEKKAEIEGKIGDAEKVLSESDARLARDLGFPLCQCTFPPQIMLWKEDEDFHACPRPACGHMKRRGMKISREAVERSGRRDTTGWMAG